MILFGEHAVVHGAAAVALPLGDLPIRATATWRDGPLTLASTLFTGPLAQAPALLEAPIAVVHACLTAFDLPSEGIAIEVSGEIPAERGLGSSAAVAGALVTALADLAGRELSEEEYLELVAVGERVAHGRPSGLDARATAASGPLLFEAGAARVLASTLTGVLVVADSGCTAAPGRRSRASPRSWSDTPCGGPPSWRAWGRWRTAAHGISRRTGRVRWGRRCPPHRGCCASWASPRRNWTR